MRLLNAFGRISSAAVVGGAGAFFGGYWLVRYLRPRYSPLVLNGAVVVITGASAGIGRAYAEAFARRGANIVLVARRAELLEEVRKEIEPYAAAVLTIPIDITEPNAGIVIAVKTLERFGKISVLINNAGQAMNGPLDTLDPDKIAQMLDVNLKAAILLTRHALPSMLTRGRGVVINVASIAGRVSGIGFNAYSATKAGLLAFSDGLRRDVHGTGVQVISVIPGYTRTSMVPDHVADYMETQGFVIQTAEKVAELTIAALLNSQNEVFICGPMERAGAYLDRRYPNLMSVVLQYMNSPARMYKSRQ